MKKQKKLFVVLVAVALLVCSLICVTACKKHTDDSSNVPQTPLGISASFLELNEGETAQLSISGARGGETLTYASEDSAIASVTQDGMVTAISYGQTVIEVRVDESTFRCTVQVNARLTGVLAAFIRSDVSEEGKIQLLPGDEYELRVEAQKGAETLKNGSFSVEWKTEGNGFTLTPDETDKSKATLKALEFGEAQITAAVTYLGESVASDEFSAVCREIYLLSNGYENNVIRLVGEKTVAGNAAEKYHKVKPNLIYKTVVSKTAGVIDSSEMEWTIADESVAEIGENGTIHGLKEGETEVVGKSDTYGEISMKIEVWNAISSPEDLDALALATYYNDEETARKILSRRYLLTNDIDYSTHVRNFMLPIASPSGALYGQNKAAVDATDCFEKGNGNILWAISASVRANNPMNMKVAHYSLTWKALLGLTDATETIGDKTVHYLVDSEGNEFKGINPKLVPFTGEMNGNGYSIKNAWVMADNFVLLMPNDSYATIGAGNCFIGINSGTITNIGFESINLPNTNVTYDLTKTDGLKTEMKYKQYWHNASQSSMTLNGQYCGLSASAYVKANLTEPTGICLQANTSRRDQAMSLSGALILSNLGTINNVYFDYASCSTTAGWNGDRARGDGLVFVNASEISDCLVVRHDPAEEQFGASFNQSQEYAAQYLIAYVCETRFTGKPSISNAAAYNDTASKKYGVKLPEYYAAPADGKGISALSVMPDPTNNGFVSLKRITGKKFDPILTDVNDINWKDLFGFDF